jgi:hypothetical protein
MGRFLSVEARREHGVPSHGSVPVARFPDDDDLIRVMKRNRPQQYSLDRVEDSSIRTDPDSQCGH